MDTEMKRICKKFEQAEADYSFEAESFSSAADSQ